jgi:hypothetical protein
MKASLFRLALVAAMLLAGCSDLGDPYEFSADCDRLPGGVFFGQVEVGRFEERVITIRNSGNADLPGDASTDSPHYQIESGGGPFVIPPLESHQIVLRFAPADTGLHRADVELGTGCAPVALAGVGGIPADGPRCVVDPPALAFGEVDLGTMAEDTLQIRNIGLIAIAVDVASSCPATFLVLEGAGAAIVAPGDTLRVRGRFAPAASGPVACQLETGTPCGPVSLSGNGTSPATVSFTGDIKPIFTARCVVCHDRLGQAGLDLRPATAWASLVNITSTGYAPVKRVVPGAPASSVLYNKVANTGLYGERMPPNGQGFPVPANEVTLIQTWIQEGALDN